MPGGAQTVTPGPGSIQLQPALISVASVTPWESADSPEETAPPDAIALGADGDAQAPIPSPPSTTNKVHARLNTFDILGLRETVTSERPTVAGRPSGRLFSIAQGRGALSTVVETASDAGSVLRRSPRFRACRTPKVSALRRAAHEAALGRAPCQQIQQKIRRAVVNLALGVRQRA